MRIKGIDMERTIVLYFLLGVVWSDPVDSKAHQVHIAFGNKTNDIVVTWSTYDPADSVVKYGKKALDNQAKGSSFLFHDGSSHNIAQWIHNVVLQDLNFNTHYEYQVKTEVGWHGNFSFKTPPMGQNWPMSIAFYGDLGITNGHNTIEYLTRDVNNHMYDMILHVGDFAYDMHERDGKQGDDFMNLVEPIAANVPYMTCQGNHEAYHNFSHYKNRFTMPGFRNESDLFYSFNLGPVHFVSISSEVYYFYKPEVAANQYKWLVNDLTEANKKENRKLRPWVILYAHRPMYCSNTGDECPNKNVPMRVQLEHLLMKFGVDIAIWAHQHSYERTWPQYNYKVYNSTNKNPYVNPLAPIHIVTGSAGCREGNDRFIPRPYWSAFQSRDKGYTTAKIYNGTHIYMEQVSTEHGEKVIDTFWVVQEKHGPFPIKHGLESQLENYPLTTAPPLTTTTESK